MACAVRVDGEGVPLLLPRPQQPLIATSTSSIAAAKIHTLTLTVLQAHLESLEIIARLACHPPIGLRGGRGHQWARFRLAAGCEERVILHDVVSSFAAEKRKEFQLPFFTLLFDFVLVVEVVGNL